ncbi:ATP-binding protein [Melghirimyces algeriensis]|uniref:histidine kinase n=1 Tax=Melghirimyces algeriensis TaxID=910412 RepID=A0A521D9L7_9BACL|nr:ATP-binding protein [Melghirimyces algeriensis]SMO68325.1 diguanylate cyclase (GGDEF) domain-containing protein [Melghirimyces algeriensis]
MNEFLTLETPVGQGLDLKISATVVTICLPLVWVLIWKRHEWSRSFPVLLYPLTILVLVGVIDFCTGNLGFLWVYLISFVLLYERSTPGNIVCSTILFFSVYSILQYGIPPFEHLDQLVGEAILFVFCAWFIIFLQRTRQHTDELRHENRNLLKKMDEAHTRLHEYIEELEETNRRDYLTGVYNLSGFQEQVTKILSRCLAANQSYHVVCVDLVDFQQVNMKEGIDVGDQLLVEVARQLKKELPAYAQVARYDGDQFTVGAVGDDATLRLCLDTVEQVIGGLRSEHGLVNYCIGTATFPEEVQNTSELIRLAEYRLSIEQKRIRHQKEERRRHLEKLSAVGQLAAGLAHEIRNPLTSIRGFIQLSSADSPEVKKWESVILPEIDRINDLLKQFLHLSECRPARYTLFNLDRLIDDVLQLLNPRSILMGHELVTIRPDTPVIIEADAEQLKQVLINLMQNGLESLQDKGVIKIFWKEIQNRISIQIQDNGSGIPPEYMSRIFDPFFTTKEDGTGIGLSICHRIITEHGGQIYVTSQPGRGTTFNIHLPLRQPSSKKAVSRKQQEGSDISLNRSEVLERVNLLKNF